MAEVSRLQSVIAAVAEKAGSGGILEIGFHGTVCQQAGADSATGSGICWVYATGRRCTTESPGSANEQVFFSHIITRYQAHDRLINGNEFRIGGRGAGILLVGYGI